jgi:hypothetical protein
MDSSTPTLTLKMSELKLDYTPSIEQLKLVFPGAQKNADFIKAAPANPSLN